VDDCAAASGDRTRVAPMNTSATTVIVKTTDVRGVSSAIRFWRPSQVVPSPFLLEHCCPYDFT
jgi:hypothetical protein